MTVLVTGTLNRQVWDFEKFQSYLTEHEQLPDDWVEKTLKVCNNFV